MKNRPNIWVLLTIAVVHASVAALTWRDIRNRTAAQVRGRRSYWKVASGLNTAGSVAYWVFGRR